MGMGNAHSVELGAGALGTAQYVQSKHGAQVTVLKIRRDGGRAVALRGDLRVISECLRLVDQAAEAFEALHILIKDARVTHARNLGGTIENAFDELFDRKARIYRFCAQRAVPHMRRSSIGRIINISPVHGCPGFRRHSVYAGTVDAIFGCRRALALEVTADYTRVIAVGSGTTEESHYSEMPGYISELSNDFVPWRRMGDRRRWPPWSHFSPARCELRHRANTVGLSRARRRGAYRGRRAVMLCISQSV